MKRLHFATAVSGILVSVAGLLFACGGDDTIEPTGDGGDTSDASSDRGAGDTDQSAPDAGPGDTGTDAPVFPDAGLTLDNFRSKIAEARCRALARCCFGNADLDEDAGVDGGTYDQDTCSTLFTAVGLDSQATEFPSTNANLVLDNAKANECIARLTDSPCDTPGTEHTAAAKACFAALVGKQKAGDACTKSIECQPGNFRHPNDAGVGACEATRGLNGKCGDWEPGTDQDTNASVSGEACSYRGKGVDTGLYCSFFDFDAGDYLPQASWTCKQAGSVGANCANNAWCTDALCDPDGTCKSPQVLIQPTPPGSASGCGKFVKTN